MSLLDKLDVDNFDPLTLFKEELKSSDSQNAVSCLKRMRAIALALGPDRTRKRMLPFLLEYCEGSTEDVLIAAAEQISDFVEAVGGPENLHELVPLLLRLSGDETDSVREAAVRTIKKLAPQFPRPDDTLMHFISSLYAGKSYAMRESACAFFEVVYPLVSKEPQEELREVFATLSQDEATRKATAQYIGTFGAQVQKEFFSLTIAPILKSLSTDATDAIRVHAVTACSTLTGILDTEDFNEHLLPLIDVMQDDTAWRVRKCFCEKCPEICKNVGETVASQRILPLFTPLITDKEGGVREKAATVIPDLCEICKAGIPQIVPFLDTVANDQSPAVRLVLAKRIVKLSPTLGLELASKVLPPLVLQMCRDDSVEVRSQIASNVEGILQGLPAECLRESLVLPALVDLSSDSKWRVRVAILSQFPLLAKHVGPFDFKLPQALTTLLVDPVYAVRELCCTQINEVAKLFGEAWGVDKLFTPGLALFANANYLHRLAALSLIIACSGSCSGKLVAENFMPVVLRARSDAIPNVRIMATRALKGLFGVIGNAPGPQCKMCDDPHPGVMHCEECDEIMCTKVATAHKKNKIGRTHNVVPCVSPLVKLRQTIGELVQDPDCDVGYFAAEVFRGLPPEATEGKRD